MKKTFWERLIRWYAKEGRDLPWRQTTNPYKILVSEMMLQQTQVDRVIPKYLSWIKQFPDINSLACASRQDVLLAWSGLGYNSRAARLHTLAKTLASSGTELPSAEEELVRLPGIGSYTAGAVRAFAFNEPGTFLDVNVNRVLSRVLFTKKELVNQSILVQELLSAQEAFEPKKVGNALMDLGARYCKASKPLCSSCPVFAACKSQGEREEEQSFRKKNKQSTFLHSVRWYRGRIVRALTKKPYSLEELERVVLDDVVRRDRFIQAISQLEKEGLVRKKKTFFSIAKE